MESADALYYLRELINLEDEDSVENELHVLEVEAMDCEAF